MSPKQQKNYRLPDNTLEQLEQLKAKTGMTEVQVIIIAIDRYAQQELARQQAQEHGE